MTAYERFAAGGWTFDDGELSRDFDAYVREQLPFYDLATLAVADIVRLHLPPGGVVVDMGASTGNVGRAIAGVLEDRMGTLFAVEPSAEMRANYRGPGEVVGLKAQDFSAEDWGGADVIVSFLTLAFVPPVERRPLIRRWIEGVQPGGAVVVVERVQAEPALLCRHLIHAAKARSGSTEADLLSKEVAIAGVLRPLAADLLPALGGSLFFAYGDFRGYVIEVPE